MSNNLKNEACRLRRLTRVADGDSGSRVGFPASFQRGGIGPPNVGPD